MKNMISAKEFSVELLEQTNDRFIADVDSSTIELYESFYLDNDKKCIRFKKRSIQVDSWKTFLFTSINSIEELKDALVWTANVKDHLSYIEGTDLYLVLLMVNPFLSEDEILGYETTELFCRKYIIRNDETIHQFMERTVFSNLVIGIDSEAITDPFQAALQLTSQSHPQFTKEKIEQWKSEILSGKSGIELVDSIF
ncbi:MULTISPECIES: hypothetical protein [Sphingobacterium]|uniref:hypothetical protein n=1 Tax=Sphingobacterium TaxID=28453 RepID=UPI00258078D8|nr:MULTISPECIES: hypothetical protein [Sphingobacterium]